MAKNFADRSKKKKAKGLWQKLKVLNAVPMVFENSCYIITINPDYIVTINPGCNVTWTHFNKSFKYLS